MLYCFIMCRIKIKFSYLILSYVLHQKPMGTNMNSLFNGFFFYLLRNANYAKLEDTKKMIISHKSKKEKFEPVNPAYPSHFLCTKPRK